ncbi:transcriptional repressor [Romeria aff. gracilis LEGE 07310]|uniref:Transcriptional repressor n=1 Tax=Vasconcelosia minhoensis LEGE 07310 TaxID=915328 RepID=A0A8J7DD93_9CYAN|nr:transcriptional repressor [Romeria aff. gracilis LEGE 07310]
MNRDPYIPITRQSDPTPPGSANLTVSQDAVLKALGQERQPLSAQALYGLMRRQKSIGLATVYRALGALELLGLVQHRANITGENLYSVVEQDCHYLTCLQCHQSVPVNSCPVQELETKLQHSSSFRIYYHTLEFFGLCGLCAQA